MKGINVVILTTLPMDNEDVIKNMPASTKEEFAAVEQEIAARFKGDRGKCSFLRSSAFQRLRIRALYQQSEEDFTVYYNGMKIVLSNGQVKMQWIKPDVNEETCCGKHPLEIDEI
jgi:hypothetical protein